MTTAYGFGALAKGGAGGKVVAITSLHDDGSKGTLRRLLEDTDPPFIVRSNVRGVIPLAANMVLRQPCVTLDLPGITLTRWGLVIRDPAHDVIVRNLTVDVGPSNDADTSSALNKDGITIYGQDGPVRRVLVDRCTFRRALDENANPWDDFAEVTFQFCRFADGLHSGHPQGDHSMGMIAGGSKQKYNSRLLTLYRCVFENNGSRNPQLACHGRVDMVNCVVSNWTSYATYLQKPSTSGVGVQVNLIGNMYLPGLAGEHPHRLPIQMDPDMGFMSVYVNDNYWHGYEPLSPWSHVAVGTNGNTPAPPFCQRRKPWPTEEPYRCPVEAASAELANKVMQEAGAR